MNLLANSLNALADGDGTPKAVVIAAQQKEDDVCLTVTDTGHGIPPELSQDIWRPGWTTSAHRAGMGLTVVRHLAQGLGGSAELNSGEPGRTQFSVTFPLARSTNGVEADSMDR